MKAFFCFQKIYFMLFLKSDYVIFKIMLYSWHVSKIKNI